MFFLNGPLNVAPSFEKVYVAPPLADRKSVV
jgi:hypothetical protein